MSEQPHHNLSALGQSAVDYARRGMWVFPLDPRGKKPLGRLVPHGLTQATNDVQQVAEWWHKAPNANIGISCGPSKLVVIDVDPRHGGDESIRDLMAKYPELDDTLTGETGGGGWHLCFLAPAVPIANSTGTLAPGLDVRGVGGYIVAPPSIHPDGKAYEWMVGYGIEEKQPARLPLPLIELLQTSEGKSRFLGTETVLEGVLEGDRDNQLFKLASSFRGAGVPIQYAYEMVKDAAAKSNPPFPPDEARRKVESAYRYPEGRVAIATPREVDPETGELLPLERVDLWPYVSGEAVPPVFVVEDIVIASHVHLVYGEPGCGKTILAERWMLDCVVRGEHVMFIDEESGTGMTADRLRAMGANAAISDYLHYYPFPGITLEDAERLMSTVGVIRPALVVFDSMADVLSAGGLDENGSMDVTRWMMGIAVRIAREYGAAVLILDHNTKDASNTKYSRGSGAKKAKADIAWFVEKKQDFDANTTGRVTLERTKNRIGFMKERVEFVVGGKDGALTVERFDVSKHKGTSVSVGADRCLTSIASGHNTPKKLEVAMGVGGTTVRTRLEELERLKFIERKGETSNRTLVLTEEGLHHLLKSVSTVVEPTPPAISTTLGGSIGAPVVELGVSGGPPDETIDMEMLSDE